VTGKRTRAFDQVPQLGVGREMHTEAIGREGLALASPSRPFRRRYSSRQCSGILKIRGVLLGRRRSGRFDCCSTLQGLRRDRWYLRARWHAADLLSDIRSRKTHGEKFLDLSSTLTSTRLE